MALMGLLALASLTFIALVSMVVLIFGLFPKPDGQTRRIGFWEALWSSLLRTLDPGTMGADEGRGFRIAMLIVTIGGIVLVASLISVISSAFNTRVEDLRKGRSLVLESDHTVILGWSNKVFPIVQQICVANASRGKAAIVILAKGDKVELEDEIRARVPSRGKTRVIVRSGDPMDLTDLDVVSPHQARSIIILAPDGSGDADSVVIKTALALTNHPRRKVDQYRIVGEIQESRNLEVARLVGKEEADWVLTGDLMSRITVQTSRQSGLSTVYTDLLDFDGDEIYFSEQPILVGKTYFELQLVFESCCLIGLLVDDEAVLNPPADTVYRASDKLILIAEDDSKIVVGDPGVVDACAISAVPPRGRGPEHALVLGYNPWLRTMLDELDEYVAPGSSVTVVADIAEPSFRMYDNIKVDFIRGDSANRATLEGLGVETFHHIAVLSNRGMLEPQAADAKTLITLLHLRDMAEVLGVDLHVVSEMLDDRNRKLAEVTKADDFIVSDKLVSLMLSQISESKHLARVFDTLFSHRGSEIYLRPAGDYIVIGSLIDFYTVAEAARRRGETAIGYRRSVETWRTRDGDDVVINPSKAQKVRFAAGDRIVVLAES